MSLALNTKLKISHAAVLIALAALSGCSTVSDMLEPERVDYKSASKANKGSTLEVPPDLTQIKGDNRYSVDNLGGTATASEYGSKQRPSSAAAQPEGKVAPAVAKDAALRVERDGKQRWLVANESPETLWPRIRTFWADNGFQIATDNPAAGVMETDWAENRAKIPQGFIRNTVGKVFDSLYSTGERDKFRTRLERRPDGGTEIYISHRGAEEKLTGQAPNAQTTVWTARPSDPELEAEFLGRLMATLGAPDAKAAKAAVKDAKPAASERARIAKDGSAVEVDESFDRAWRRVGLALDRVGFTVEDRDRARGVYFVRYIDQGADAKDKGEPGFFARLFGAKSESKSPVRYQVAVKESGAGSRISVLDEKGGAVADANAKRILSLLNDQLK